MERLLLQQQYADHLKLRDISRGGQNIIIVAPTTSHLQQRPTVYPGGATTIMVPVEIPLTGSTRGVPLHQRFSSPSYGGGIINRQEGIRSIVQEGIRSTVKPADPTTTLFSSSSRNIVSPTDSPTPTLFPPSRVVRTRTADSSNLHLPSRTVKSGAATNLQSCMNNTNLTRQWINKNIKTIEQSQGRQAPTVMKGGGTKKKAEYSHNLMTSKSARPVSSSKRFFRKRRTDINTATYETTKNTMRRVVKTKMSSSSSCVSTTCTTHPSQMMLLHTPPRNCSRIQPVMKNHRLQRAVADEAATIQSLLSMGSGMKKSNLDRPIQRNERTVSSFLRTIQRK